MRGLAPPKSPVPPSGVHHPGPSRDAAHLLTVHSPRGTPRQALDPQAGRRRTGDVGSGLLELIGHGLDEIAPRVLEGGQTLVLENLHDVVVVDSRDPQVLEHPLRGVVGAADGVAAEGALLVDGLQRRLGCRKLKRDRDGRAASWQPRPPDSAYRPAVPQTIDDRRCY